MLADIDKAAAAVDNWRLRCRPRPAQSNSAPADLSITVDGVPQTLTAGQVWTQRASAAVVVDVPGLLSVRIDPVLLRCNSGQICSQRSRFWPML